MLCDRVGTHRVGKMEAGAGFLGVTWICVQIVSGLTPGSVTPLLGAHPEAAIEHLNKMDV